MFTTFTICLNAKTQSVPLHDVLLHHISVFLLRDLPDSSECKGNGPSKSISLCLFLLVKETYCWPLGSSKVGRWEGSVAAAQRNANGLVLFEHASKYNGAEAKCVSSFIFLSSSLSELNAEFLAQMATYNHSNPIWQWDELGNKNQESSTSWQCAVGRKEQFGVAVHQ